jgi:hypothetical protein
MLNYRLKITAMNQNFIQEEIKARYYLLQCSSKSIVCRLLSQKVK